MWSVLDHAYPARLAPAASVAEGLRPSDSPPRSLAGAPSPAPLARCNDLRRARRAPARIPRTGGATWSSRSTRASSMSAGRPATSGGARLVLFRRAGLPRALARLDGQLAAAHLPMASSRSRSKAHHTRSIRWSWRGPIGTGNGIDGPAATSACRLPHGCLAVFVLRQLEQLSLRIWDEGTDGAADRLGDPALLDRLNSRGRRTRSSATPAG